MLPGGQKDSVELRCPELPVQIDGNQITEGTENRSRGDQQLYLRLRLTTFLLGFGDGGKYLHRVRFDADESL